jgi:hypothetical protein
MTNSAIQDIAKRLHYNKGVTVFKKSAIIQTAKDLQYSYETYADIFKKANQVRFGHYDISAYLPLEDKEAIPENSLALSSPIVDFTFTSPHIPKKSPSFIKWGDYAEVEKIVYIGKFFPIYISGLSGNGKSIMVQQVCANLNREMIRIQVDGTTDDTDLIGSYALVNGDTIFKKGPVINAMEAGQILLLDEIDRGLPSKMMCLQGILEGDPVLIKKTGEVIHPKPGFNIIATANTLGRGSEDGKYVAAQIIDDSFLERFVNTIEQKYPSQAIEKRIVLSHMEKYGKIDDDFASKLVAWSFVIRKTYDEGAIDDLISTRRLCHIVNTFSVFEDRLVAINKCISRFEKDTRNAFLDLYTKVDPSVRKI